MARLLLICCVFCCVSCDSMEDAKTANIKVVEMHFESESDQLIAMRTVIGDVSYGPGALRADCGSVMLTPMEINKDFIVHIGTLNEESSNNNYRFTIPHASWSDVIDVARKFKLTYMGPNNHKLEIYSSLAEDAKPIRVISDFEFTHEKGLYIHKTKYKK